MPLPCAAPSVPLSHGKVSEKDTALLSPSCFGKFRACCGNFIPLKNVPLVATDPSNYGYSVLGGEVPAWACSRGAGTRGIARLRRQGKSRMFYQEAEALSMPVTIMHVFFMPIDLCQGPEPSCENQGGALRKLAPVLTAGVGCTGGWLWVQ